MANKDNSERDLRVIEEIEEKIYVVRGKNVMLDSDLAELYQVETKLLTRAVRRNMKRFPPDFVFQLDRSESDSLRRQIGTSKTGRGGRRYLPYVFTDHGAVMLATVLNSPTAVEASIFIVRAFVKMRGLLSLHKDLADRVSELEKVTVHHDRTFGVVSRLLGEILRDPKHLKRKIGFVEPKKVRAKKQTSHKNTKGD